MKKTQPRIWGPELYGSWPPRTRWQRLKYRFRFSQRLKEWLRLAVHQAIWASTAWSSPLRLVLPTRIVQIRIVLTDSDIAKPKDEDEVTKLARDKIAKLLLEEVEKHASIINFRDLASKERTYSLELEIVDTIKRSLMAGLDTY